MRFLTLNEWLTWQEGLHSTEIELGLARVRTVAENLQLLSPTAKVVTVAGTNGKGSCIAVLESLLLAQGDKVGAFTSPHLLRYNERIRINGVDVSDEMLCQSFQRIDAARCDVSLTYFEFGTLAAMDIFRQLGVDYWLLEVGLGGRLDAVNILNADIAIVTSVALDHEAWLGSDIVQIGREKAGIFRTNRWAVCADELAPVSVSEQAKFLGARYIAMGESMRVTNNSDSSTWSWQGVDGDGNHLTLNSIATPNLPLNSVAAALQAYLLLDKKLDQQTAAVLSDTTLVGRSQVICRNGMQFILDVAHNPAAAEFQAKKLSRMSATGKTYCLAAIMQDKQRRSIFEQFDSVIDEWHPCGLPEVSRAARVEVLEEDLKSLNFEAMSHTTVTAGLQWLLANGTEGDRVLVMGSFFTIAEALSFFNQTTDQQE